MYETTSLGCYDVILGRFVSVEKGYSSFIFVCNKNIKAPGIYKRIFRKTYENPFLLSRATNSTFRKSPIFAGSYPYYTAFFVELNLFFLVLLANR